MDRVTSMLSFVKVVESAGFSAAARHLNLSTSVITGHVQALEARLGVRLLNRSTRKVSLTEVGQAYYERCVQILSDIENADQIAEALQSTPRGTLQINMAPVLQSVFAPTIAEYAALYPEVSVRITVTSRMVDLIEDGFDIALRIIPVSESSLVIRRLASYRFVVCGAPKYFAKYGHPSSPADLANHNCVTFSDSPWNRDWHFKKSRGEQVVQAQGNLQVNGSDALRLAGVLGQGLIYVPSFLVAEDLSEGRLVQTLSAFMPMELTVDVIYPHRRHLPAKVRSFIDLAAKNLRGVDWGAATPAA